MRKDIEELLKSLRYEVATKASEMYADKIKHDEQMKAKQAEIDRTSKFVEELEKILSKEESEENEITGYPDCSS